VRATHTQKTECTRSTSWPCEPPCSPFLLFYIFACI